MPVEGVTGNEGPKSLLDVCHDLVECTNAADWPHEYGVAQNAGGQHAVEKAKRALGFVGLLLWLLLRSENAGNAGRNEEVTDGEVVGSRRWARV